MKTRLILVAGAVLAVGSAWAQAPAPEDRFEVVVVDVRDDQALAQPNSPLFHDFLVKKGFKRGPKSDAVTVKITDKQSQETRFATIVPYVHGSSPRKTAAGLIYLEKGQERKVHAGVFEFEEWPVKGQKVEKAPRPKVKDYDVRDGQVVEATGFSWDCFMKQIVGTCGFGAFGCIWSGPAWPYCVIGVCGGGVAYSVWVCW